MTIMTDATLCLAVGISPINGWLSKITHTGARATEGASKEGEAKLRPAMLQRGLMVINPSMPLVRRA